MADRMNVLLAVAIALKRANVHWYLGFSLHRLIEVAELEAGICIEV